MKRTDSLRSLILEGLERKELSRKELGDAIGLDTPVSVSKWIREDRQDPVPWRHWRRICRVLGIPWARWYRIAKKELPESTRMFDKYFA